MNQYSGCTSNRNCKVQHMLCLRLPDEMFKASCIYMKSFLASRMARASCSGSLSSSSLYIISSSCMEALWCISAQDSTGISADTRLFGPPLPELFVVIAGGIHIFFLFSLIVISHSKSRTIRTTIVSKFMFVKFETNNFVCPDL